MGRLKVILPSSSLLRHFDWLFLAVAGLAVVITRWAYHSKYLFHWDSVQFALSLQGIDILAHRPHPPGYVFYVWLGQLAKLFTKDDNLAFVAVGILAGLVGVFVIYWLARSLFKDRIPAVLAVVFFIFNTSIWFHGLVAEVYIVESVTALIAIWLIYRYWQKPPLTNLVVASLWLGLVGGFRQTTELALLPLLIFAIWQHKSVLRHWLMSGIAILLTSLFWLMPVLIDTGGLANYLSSLATLSDIVVGQYYRSRGVFIQIMVNLGLVGEALVTAVIAELGLILISIAPYLVQGSNPKFEINRKMVQFWSLALGGPLILTTFLLMTNPGYILLPVILICLLTAGAVWAFFVALRSVWQKFASLWLCSATLVVLVFQSVHFYTTRPEQFAFISPSLLSITRHAELMESILGTIAANSTPTNRAVWINTDNTIIFFGFRHMQYYLPDTDIYRGLPKSLIQPKGKLVWHAKGLGPELYEDKIYLSPSIEKLFTLRGTWDLLREKYQIPLTMPSGHTLVYYDLTDPATRDYLVSHHNVVLLSND